MVWIMNMIKFLTKGIVGWVHKDAQLRRNNIKDEWKDYEGKIPYSLGYYRLSLKKYSFLFKWVLRLSVTPVLVDMCEYPYISEPYRVLYGNGVMFDINQNEGTLYEIIYRDLLSFLEECHPEIKQAYIKDNTWSDEDTKELTELVNSGKSKISFWDIE